MSLRGFDGFGAAAAITQASASGFTATGVFRDAADFAVVVLFDADDFWGHPRLKYLPDFNLAGLVLSFDLLYNGLQPLDSAKFPTIDWAYLDLALADGSSAQVPLFAHATQAGGNYLAASAVFTITASPAVAFDRVTLWYENVAFDYIASGGETATEVASILAGQVNTQTQDLVAVASGASITITAAKPGVDGNMITLYSQSKTLTLRIVQAVQQLQGGSSSVTWNVSIDFTALKIDQVRQMWLTLAPPLQNGQAYTGGEWTATFSNWNVSDSNGVRPLQVAGPNSVRVEEADSWCTFRGGSWLTQSGSYSRGFAKSASTIGDGVTVTYWCGETHNLYLGTGLYTDRGVLSVVVDGGPAITLDTYLNTTSEVVARRLIQSTLPPGQHTVKLTVAGSNPLSSGSNCYFDFIEAAVLSDVPDPPGPWAGRMPAVDYDTQHGYQLPPARLMWMLQTLGFAGEIDLYIGVFWWMRKTRSGGSVPSVTIDFSQTGYVSGDGVFVIVGGETYGKSVFPADTADSIAAHFGYFINEVAAGVWAESSGSVLTITLRAVGSSYSFAFSASKNSTPLSFTGSLTGGVLSTWIIDTSQSNPLNVAASAWLADFLSLSAAASLNVCAAYSMELCYPPDEWVSLFADGSPVTTATGFGTINSSQCAPGNSGFLAYQQSVYLATAALMAAAGLPIVLQCGEFLWWYFADASGMAYYDPETVAAAQAALGRPLHTFLTPNDNPSLNSADALFLRNRLRDHVAAIAATVKESFTDAQLEVLYPYDVNYPLPAGADLVGGALNYYVNTPVEWQGPGTLQRIKIEALDREASSRNLDLAIQAMQLPLGWGWPPGLVRYLYGCYNGGSTWERSQLAAESLGLAGVTAFALDHVCLFGWELADPVIRPKAQVM